MAQVSKYKLFAKEEAEIKSLFNEVISTLSDTDDITDFLDDFLSPTERIVFSKRITIALLLKQGCPYEIIKKTLKVSAPTIADVSLKLKYAGKGYHKILDRIMKQQKISRIIGRVENFALEVATIGKGKGSNFWFNLKRKKQQSSTKII